MQTFEHKNCQLKCYPHTRLQCRHYMRRLPTICPLQCATPTITITITFNRLNWKLDGTTVSRALANYVHINFGFSTSACFLLRSPSDTDGRTRGVAMVNSVGINGPRRQNNHIKKFKVDWFGGIYTDIPPVATPLGRTGKTRTAAC